MHLSRKKKHQLDVHCDTFSKKNRFTGIIYSNAHKNCSLDIFFQIFKISGYAGHVGAYRSKFYCQNFKQTHLLFFGEKLPGKLTRNLFSQA